MVEGTREQTDRQVFQTTKIVQTIARVVRGHLFLKQRIAAMTVYVCFIINNSIFPIMVNPTNQISTNNLDYVGKYFLFIFEIFLFFSLF